MHKGENWTGGLTPVQHIVIHVRPHDRDAMTASEYMTGKHFFLQPCGQPQTL
jgi:hypothetical protein